MGPYFFREKTYASLRALKIARTHAAKPRSNLWRWQKTHNIPRRCSDYRELEKNGDLAELIGTVLGDGCIEAFPRTEKITIAFNRNEQRHLRHIRRIMRLVFGKTPSISISKTERCDKLVFYQKFLSKRLNFPTGEKKFHDLKIPSWVKRSKRLLRRCMKGLFESDGCWVVDHKWKSNVIFFKNTNQSLLDEIYEILVKLGYHPQRRPLETKLARVAEVEKFARWIRFRTYGHDRFVPKKSY